MRRLIVPIALFLALTTGAWIGQAVTFFSEPMAFEAETLRAEDTVRDFYDAVQSFLVTGDLTGVRDAVSEDFVDHAVRPGIEPTQDGLVGYLELLRQTFPDLRIEPREIVVQHERVVALVDVTWSQAAPFLGMSLSGIVPWGRLDLFHVSADRVVAHWGDSTGNGLFAPIVSGVFSGRNMHGFAPALTRKTYEPGAGDGDRTTWGPAVLLVEDGNLLIDTDESVLATVVRSSRNPWSDAETELPIETSDPVTLGPGDIVTMVEPGKIETRNDTSAPASVLVLSLGTPKTSSPGGSMPSAESPGLTLRQLAGGHPSDSVAHQYGVAIGRAVLSPGTGLESHVVGGQELLLVESGSLALTVGGGTAWTRQPNQTATVVDGAGTLLSGTGLSIPEGATAAYRNGGTEAVSILLVTILPMAEPDQ